MAFESVFKNSYSAVLFFNWRGTLHSLLFSLLSLQAIAQLLKGSEVYLRFNVLINEDAFTETN
jgi:hypothetical protein